MNAATLIPRPETETLVELVLAEARSRFPPDVSICDLGTGSGAIAIALLSELPEARAVATDISEEALSIAMLNAERHGVRSRTDVSQGATSARRPDGPFDIVVSNPPYIRSDVIATLAREVREHDPRVALDGGPDGLAAYRAILEQRQGTDRARAAFLRLRSATIRANRSPRSAARQAWPRSRSTWILQAATRVVMARKGVVRGQLAGVKKTAWKSRAIRASFRPQTRVKPQSWHSFPADNSEIAESWLARVAIA